MIPPGSTPVAGQSWDQLSLLPGVADAMSEARAMVDRLLMHRVLRTRTPVVAAESALRGARASAALEGEDVPLEELRSGPALSPALAGALRVQAELPRLRQVWHASPRQALARLHVLAAADLTVQDGLGRPVDKAAAEAIGRVSDLVLAPASAPAALVAAVVHGELASAAPFDGGNGVIARAAARLVLADKGLDPALLSVPEVGHLELGDYAEAMTGYAVGERAGVADWLVHCARALVIGARESLAVAEAMIRG